MKVAGPALSKVGIRVFSDGGISIDDVESKIPVNVMEMAVEALFSKLDEDHITGLIKKLLSETTRVDPKLGNQPLGNTDMFDLAFSGNGLQELPGAIMFALEVNYAHFLDGSGPIGAILGKLKGLQKAVQLQTKQSQG